MEQVSFSQDMKESKLGGQETEEEEEEEYVLLDLGGISDHVSIPPNAPYELSGLDTLNPILLIDNKIKLIGEYEETVGTCFVFNESDAAPIAHEEAQPSEASRLSGKCMTGPKQTPTKQVNMIARLNKVLKFRPFLEASGENRVDKQADLQS